MGMGFMGPLHGIVHGFDSASIHILVAAADFIYVSILSLLLLFCVYRIYCDLSY